MSDSGPKTPLSPASSPPVRKKAPFFRLPRPQIRPSDPPFPAQSPRKSPIFGPFPSPRIRTNCPYSPLVACTPSLVSGQRAETPSPPAPLPQRGEGRVSLDFACPLRGERVARLAGAGEGSFVGADFKPARGCPVTQLPLFEVAALRSSSHEKAASRLQSESCVTCFGFPILSLARGRPCRPARAISSQ